MKKSVILIVFIIILLDIEASEEFYLTCLFVFCVVFVCFLFVFVFQDFGGLFFNYVLPHCDTSTWARVSRMWEKEKKMNWITVFKASVTGQGL